MSTPRPRPPSDEIPELEFPAGLPGFTELRRFALAQWGGPYSPYSQLQSLEQAEVAFLVAPPDAFFDDYGVELPDEEATLLRLTDPADALVLVLITLTEPMEDATANLLGPLIVNTRARLAAQVVLPDSPYGTKVRLRATSAMG